MRTTTFLMLLMLFGVIGLNTSCEQETITTLQTETPVVEAYIIAGQTVDSIRVTQSINYSGQDTLLPLDDLAITLSDDTHSVDLTPIGNGYYQHPDLIIQANTSYALAFPLNDMTVVATTFVPAQRAVEISHTEISMEQIDEFGFGANQEVDPIEISWENPEGDYYYVVVENIDENPEYINLILQEVIEAQGGELPRFGFITEPQITNQYPINTRQEIQQFGLHRVIVFRVNPEYAALYESASNSSLSLSEPPSNVENGLGIFTGVSADTVYFEVKKQ